MRKGCDWTVVNTDCSRVLTFLELADTEILLWFVHPEVKRTKSSHLKQVGIEGLRRKVIDVFYLTEMLFKSG